MLLYDNPIQSYLIKFVVVKRQKALDVTGGKGVEPAMEWLLAHSDESEVAPPQAAAAAALNLSGSGGANDDAGAAGGSDGAGTSACSSTSEPTPEVKSFKCEEWFVPFAISVFSYFQKYITTLSHLFVLKFVNFYSDRLFKNQMEVEFHAAKSGHSNFSESTEEKKPLTEEEKKQQLARLEEKLRQKRSEREESEKREALEKERMRIKSGKNISEAQRKIEELEMKKLVEQRKREKQEDRAARERVRAQIEADKAARRKEMEA